jgi:hypothetical protein
MSCFLSSRVELDNYQCLESRFSGDMAINICGAAVQFTISALNCMRHLYARFRTQKSLSLSVCMANFIIGKQKRGNSWMNWGNFALTRKSYHRRLIVKI